MSKTLVVAEKPSVARDIAQALGGFENHESYLENDRYVVSWAVGHLLELLEPEELDPKYKRWLLEDLPILPEEFKLKPKQGQSERIRTLQKLFTRKDVDQVVNACDAGREGELIFRELAVHFNNQKPTWRLWLQSMTVDAIRSGFQSLKPGQEFDGLGAAAFCRSEADWLIGMNATRALTRRMKTRSETTAWSAGRVQTPTLALLAEREIEVLTHRPTPFWRIHAQFQAPSHQYRGTWFDPKFKSEPDSPRRDDWITDAAKLEQILKDVRGKEGNAKETRKPRRESAPPLFDLTSLQREGNKRFGFSARRTLAAAQRLYEQHKALTYPRTDSRALPEDYKDHVNTVLKKLSGDYGRAAAFLRQNGLQNEKKIFDNSKVSDHFAIIPTEQMPSNLEGDDLRIYDLVVRRFLAAFYPPAVWMDVERITEVAGHHFRTRARYLTEPGWYDVYGKESTDEEKVLPPLGQLGKHVEDELARALAGQDAPPVDMPRAGVRVLDAGEEADQTRPPARITESRLLSLMEHAGEQVKDDETLHEAMKGKGLGTPATRAEIIENLVSKQYARRAEKALRATPKGILLIDLLRRIHIDRLASARLTGELEKHLQEVEHGKRARSQFMSEIYDYARQIVEKAKTFAYDELYRNDPPLGQCPACKKRQVYEQSRFYSCQGNTGKDSDCSFIIWKDRNGRYIDRVTVTELLRDGITPVLEGFLTAQGKGYSARLRLTEDGQIEMVAGDSEGGEGPGPAMDAIDPNTDPIAPCPLKPGECQVYETQLNYKCEAKCIDPGGRRKIGVVLPKVVCQREISVEEAKAFFAQGKTTELTDFVSRFGRPFAATLILKDNGRHGFEFTPREGRKGSANGKAADGKAATGKAKAAKGKTAAKGKAPAKGTAAAKTKAGASAAKETAAASKSAGAKAGAKTAAKKATAKKAPAAKAAIKAGTGAAKTNSKAEAPAAEKPADKKPKVRLVTRK